MDGRRSHLADELRGRAARVTTELLALARARDTARVHDQIAVIVGDAELATAVISTLVGCVLAGLEATARITHRSAADNLREWTGRVERSKSRDMPLWELVQGRRLRPTPPDPRSARE